MSWTRKTFYEYDLKVLLEKVKSIRGWDCETVSCKKHTNQTVIIQHWLTWPISNVFAKMKWKSIMSIGNKQLKSTYISVYCFFVLYIWTIVTILSIAPEVTITVCNHANLTTTYFLIRIVCYFIVTTSFRQYSGAIASFICEHLFKHISTDGKGAPPIPTGRLVNTNEVSNWFKPIRDIV